MSLSSGLAKMVQELVAAMQQAREAYGEVQELSNQIRSEGIPELEGVEPSQQPEEGYRGYELQAEIQGLKALNEDIQAAINEMVGLLLFIRTKLATLHEQRADKVSAMLLEYTEKADIARERYLSVCSEKQELLHGLQKRRFLLEKMRRGLEEVVEISSKESRYAVPTGAYPL